MSMKNLPDCIAKTKKDGAWGAWMPYAIVGECAYEAGITSLSANEAMFNQMGCSNADGQAVHYCGRRQAEDNYDGISFARGDASEIGERSDYLTSLYESPMSPTIMHTKGSTPKSATSASARAPEMMELGASVAAPVVASSRANGSDRDTSTAPRVQRHSGGCRPASQIGRASCRERV